MVLVSVGVTVPVGVGVLVPVGTGVSLGRGVSVTVGDGEALGTDVKVGTKPACGSLEVGAVAGPSGPQAATPIRRNAPIKQASVIPLPFSRAARHLASHLCMYRVLFGSVNTDPASTSTSGMRPKPVGARHILAQSRSVAKD